MSDSTSVNVCAYARTFECMRQQRLERPENSRLASRPTFWSWIRAMTSKDYHISERSCSSTTFRMAPPHRRHGFDSSPGHSPPNSSPPKSICCCDLKIDARRYFGTFSATRRSLGTSSSPIVNRSVADARDSISNAANGVLSLGSEAVHMFVAALHCPPSARLVG
jgi:hypothetical protein